MMAADLPFHQIGAAFFLAGFALMAGAFLLGFLVLLQSCAPDLIGRAHSVLRERPLASFATGIAVTAGLLLTAVLGRKFPPAFAFAAGAFAVLAILGLAVTAENLGRRIAWISGREASRLSNLALGWLVFFGAACIPYAGWLLVLPWGVLCGLGSLVLASGRRPAPEPKPEP